MSGFLSKLARPSELEPAFLLAGCGAAEGMYFSRILTRPIPVSVEVVHPGPRFFEAVNAQCDSGIWL